MTTLLNNSHPRTDTYGTPKTLYCEKNSPFIFAFLSDTKSWFGFNVGRMNQYAFNLAIES